MKRLVAAASAVVVAASALAMPTKAELGKAQSLVAELMAPAMADYKSASAKDKASAALKVADTSVEFADAAETEAAKFLLLKGAVSFYTRGEAYDKAADAVTALQSGVKNVTPEVIAEITGKATGRISESKAPRLFALYRSAKLQVRAANEAKTLAQKLKRVKSDALQRRYAEALAVSGDWKAAYAEFAKLSNDKLKAIVEAEASGKAKNVESGEFWWGYEPAMEDADDIFKAHAAAFYRKALAVGEITGLKKNIVEQRIKPYGDAAVAPSGHGTGVSPRTPAATGLYCVIDLSGGPDAKKYPVSYLNDIPKGGWSDEYKTTKLVLRRIEPGEFAMGSRDSSRIVKLSKGFYIGVFEVTQQQWALVMANRPSFWKGEKYKTRPVESVSYEMIRGGNRGREWPKSGAVDAGSFLGVLRAKTKLNLDIPTEAQWEYACRAGKSTDFANGFNYDAVDSVSMENIGRFYYNGGWNTEQWGGFDFSFKNADRNCSPANGTACVGMYEPNAWGVYDMHGNVCEWCLDWMGACGETLDPVGVSTGQARVRRGGSWHSGADLCRSWDRLESVPEIPAYVGFRIALLVSSSFMGEAKATQKDGRAVSAAVAQPTGPIGLKTGGGSPFTVRGNEATLKLANGEKIEFVKCPPGEFKMLKGYEKNASTVKVKISRPFWIARKRMTRGQRGAIAPNVPKLQPSAGNENVTFEGNVRNADEEMLLRRLTDDFGKSLPAGYVFRLPSIAEYEYAYHANTKDWNDPYIYDDFANVNKGTVEKMRAKDDDSLANAWGLLAMANLNALMDRFPIAFAGGQRRYDERMKGIELAEGTTDPFFWCEEDAYPMTACWGNFNMRCLHNGRAYRLVIGPDLVSEWKAKNGKK